MQLGYNWKTNCISFARYNRHNLFEPNFLLSSQYVYHLESVNKQVYRAIQRLIERYNTAK